MSGEWRSAAAQTFVGGRITQVDSYWPANTLAADVFQLIDDWDLWGEAFGGKAKKIKDRWRTMLVLRNGVKSAGGLVRKVGGVLGGKSEAGLGTDLLQELKANVVTPLQNLANQAPLTINFSATGWFGTGPGFDEYITMWDRHTTDAALTANQDPKNPAHVRAKADRHALYGQFADGKTQVGAAGLVLPHVKKQGGTTAPATMHYSPNHVRAPGAAADSQVFAALNYGRRVHGSNTEYGKSVFELDDGFKKDAIYFAMDTFTPVSNGSGFKAKGDRGKLYQVSFNTFGGAILLATRSQYQANPSATHLANAKALVADLLASAHNGNPRPDSAENHLLIEAHIFRRVRMVPAQVRAVHISRGECGANLNAVQTNAAQFSRRTGVQVDYID
ncbi:MAG: hypothetical protein J0I71_11850 [Rhodanobacter sp.]|jgi:hypothetical protein|nr:hypothetical protein [Rhodanobacter sp.]ODT93598.1 MAG: hypothetical protein ABS82_12055 [Rhodanobacter sp. SCN 67-45]